MGNSTHNNTSQTTTHDRARRNSDCESNGRGVRTWGIDGGVMQRDNIFHWDFWPAGTIEDKEKTLDYQATEDEAKLFETSRECRFPSGLNAERRRLLAEGFEFSGCVTLNGILYILDP